MFRLIKLTAYALFGIAVYELIMGMMEGQPVALAPSAGRGPGRQRSGGGGGGRSASSSRLRGGGSVPIEGGDGASHQQRVGRGIINR